MPTLFPTTYSTLCPSALAEFVSQHYTLETVQCQFLTRNVNDTYLITAPGNSFILRVYRASHRTYPQIQAEVELLLALKAAEVSVSYPLQDAAGKVIQALPAAEGTRYAVLFTFAPGHSVTMLHEKQRRLLGQQMAKFHHVSSAIQLSDPRWTFDLNTTLFQPIEKVKEYFSDTPEDYLWLQDTAQKVQQKLAQLPTHPFSTGYCHFDFLPKNFHFAGNEQLTFFDFDFFGYGWLVNDLMTFWQQLCLDAHFGRMTQSEAQTAFATVVEAYRQERALSSEELAAVPYLSLGFWVYYLGFYTTHDQFYPLLQQPMLKMRMALIRQIVEKNWPQE